MTDQLPPSTDEPLPGLGDPVRTAGETALHAQVRRSLAFLSEQNLVDARHAGLMQLALDLADSVRPGERAYGKAQAAAQILAVFDRLMPDQEGGTDGFAELHAFLAGVDAAGSGPPVRDPRAS